MLTSFARTLGAAYRTASQPEFRTPTLHSEYPSWIGILSFEPEPPTLNFAREIWNAARRKRPEIPELDNQQLD